MYALIINEEALWLPSGAQFVERFQTLLGELGFSTVVATSMEAGFKHLVEKEPDLIILDDLMGNIGGVEFLPLAKRLSKAPTIVICEEGEENIVDALELGADVALTPTVTDQEFLTRVQAVIRRIEPSPA